MAINYYVGTDGPTITVENAEELYEALDLLHTQIMDTCSDDTLLRILSDAMDRVQGKIGHYAPTPDAEF